MNLQEFALLQSMTPGQQVSFATQMTAVRKSKMVAYLLLVLLGLFGVHRFYINDVKLGIIELLLFWFPVIQIIDVFMLSGAVDRYNAQLATQIAAMVSGEYYVHEP